MISELEVDISAGLSTREVVERRVSCGINRLRQPPRRSALSILIDQLKSSVVGLLAAAAVVAFLFGDSLEGWAVVLVLLLNTAIGFFTERQAVRSMEALRAMGNVQARVRRDGEVREIPAQDLVPGDVVVFEGGDVISADLRLVHASKLEADESALTGESLATPKGVDPVASETTIAERSSMLHKGTSVTRGAGEGVVVGIGMATELGAISSLVAGVAEEATPLEKRLGQLAHRLIIVSLAVICLVVVIGIGRGRDLVSTIEVGIALAVAAIPEGLPIVATLALARGMGRMVRRHALVKQLSSVETLGETSVICTDKTGTLTENKMTVARLAVASGGLSLPAGGEILGKPVGDALDRRDPLLRTAIETAVLCNSASLGSGLDGDGDVGDPLEVALLRAGIELGATRQELLESRPEVRNLPFDPDVKMMATFHEICGDRFHIAIKGAPETVIAASTRLLHTNGDIPLVDSERKAWIERNEQLASIGLRVLGLATRQVQECHDSPFEQLTFVGLVALADPLRADVKESVAQCHEAGIAVVMVTGDQPTTALRIGKEIGLVTSVEELVIHGATMKTPHLLSSEEREVYLGARLFARVSPQQKLDLIELYRSAGHIVAMTGDGVNDAPALKRADIGIAMGKRGTQVAREASDIVLQDDSFATIVAAVKEGRGIFANIRTFVFYLMSCNFGEVMVIGVATISGAALPILPVQILFLNLVTDVFPALALGVGPSASGIMQQPPRPAEEPILSHRQILHICLYGAAFTVAVLGAMTIADSWLLMTRKQTVSVSFLTLAFSQLWHVFNMREPGSRPWDNRVTRNPYVWAALAICIALILAGVYVPSAARILGAEALPFTGWLTVGVMSLIPLFLGQVLELVTQRTSIHRLTPSPCELAVGN